MPVFDHRFVVDARLPEVAAFHGDTAALRILTPPGVVLRLHQVDPLGEGSVSRFTLWFGPVPLRWTAVHRDVGPQGFTDVQQQGPLHSWAHSHRFREAGDGRVEVHDHIEYRHHAGLRGVLSRLLFSRPALRLLFLHRARATRRALR